MFSKKLRERERKIQECLVELENLHSEIMKSKSDALEWRNLAEKSVERKISILRLWQSEDRMANNLRIALASAIGAVGGGVVGFVFNNAVEKM